MSQKNLKRRNHEVPKGLLKNWLGTEGKKQGLHYVDLTNGNLMFEEGRNANFAITDFLYVPVRENDERDDALEDWFAVDEGSLADFARCRTDRDFNNLTEKVLNKAIRACISLGQRSAYSMYMAMNVFQMGATAPHAAAVDNFSRSVGSKFMAFRNWDFLVLYDLPVPVLISDRPFLDLTPRNMDLVMISLGPRSLLLGSAPSSAGRSEMLIAVQKATPDHRRIAALHNQACIAMARHWVVAGTRTELEAIASSLTPEKVLERRQTDRVILGAV